MVSALQCPSLMWCFEMFRLVVLCLALFAGSCYGDSRVVGGVETTIEQYPSLVQVELLNSWTDAWQQYCGGVILNEVFVLTAAHCVSGVLSPHRRIRAGTTYRNTGGEIGYIRELFLHPSYGVQARYDADIAIIRLQSFLVFSDAIQQAAIVGPNNVIPDDTLVYHAGWGHYQQGGPYTPVLRHTSFYTINNDECRIRHENHPNPGTVTENMICTGLLDIGGQDHCQGDSGGGIYLGSIVIGIASWGYRCGTPEYPGVSTAISPYTNWIVENTVV